MNPFIIKITNINLLQNGEGTVQGETVRGSLKNTPQATDKVPAKVNVPDIVLGMKFSDSAGAAEFIHFGEYEVTIKRVENK